MKQHRVNWKGIDSFTPIVKYLSKLKLRFVFHIVKAIHAIDFLAFVGKGEGGAWG